MKITTSWTFGNFEITASTNVETAEPVGSTAQSLMELGFLQILQRVPSSNAERHVAGASWSKNKRGTPERPKDFKRNSIAFSEETAEKLKVGFGTTAEIAEGVSIAFAIDSITEHVGSEGVSPMKRATEFVAALFDGGEKEKQLRSTLALFATGEENAMTASEATLVQIAHRAMFAKK